MKLRTAANLLHDARPLAHLTRLCSVAALPAAAMRSGCVPSSRAQGWRSYVPASIAPMRVRPCAAVRAAQFVN